MKPAHTLCGNCNRPMRKARAVRSGIAYCDACHKRLSRPAPCRSCGRTVRVHDGDDPLCKPCQAKGRSCLRCGKPVPRAGLTLPEGVACGSCARHFKPPQPCAACGEPSIRLARDKRLGFADPVCPKCRRRDHATCAGCGKHRLPAGSDRQGRPLCRDCASRGEAPFLCPSCGKEGRRHSAIQCEECYWTGRLVQATARLAEVLVTAKLSAAMGAYAGYLAEQCGAKAGFLRLKRHGEFFLALDRDPRLIADHGALLEHFGADGLRRAVTPYSFLAEQKVLSPVGRALAKEVTEKLSQRKIMAEKRDNWHPWANRLLVKFYGHLQEVRQNYHRKGWRGERQRFGDRSVTACLKAAVHFLEKHKQVPSLQDIDQEDLDLYLIDYPGWRNPLRRLISFINSSCPVFVQLSIASVGRNIKPGAFIPKDKEIEILSEICGETTPVQERLMLALMLLYARTPQQLVRLRLDSISGDPGARTIRFAKVPVLLPPEISELADRYVAWRMQTGERASNNRFLFPGRQHGAHMSEATVYYILQKRGVTARQLFATAMMQTFANGVRHPASLVRAYGISTTAAIKYFETTSTRLRNEMAWLSRQRRKKR